MKIRLAVLAVLATFANSHSQGSPDYYIASLQMPCYPPLARQAKVQGQIKVTIETGEDGTVRSAQAAEGNALLQAASLTNVRTWKFGGGQGADLSRLKTTIVFDYRLVGEPGWERCATHVNFDSWNRVEIVGHPPLALNSDAAARRP
jgi:TonB family protein